MNDYDEIAAKTFAPQPSSTTQPSGAEPTGYESVLGGLEAERTRALEQSGAVASQTSPDQAAKIQAMADKAKLPYDIVERHYDEIAATQREELDYESILKNTPKTADWLTNPNNSRVSSDDVPNLQAMERNMAKHSTALTLYENLNSGIYSLAKLTSQVPAFAWDISATAQNVAVDALGLPEYRAAFAPDALRKNVVTDFLDEQANIWKTPELDKSIVDEFNKGNYRDAGFVLANQIVANAPMQAALIAGTIAGYGVPALVGAGAVAGAGANLEAQEKVKSGEVSPETATATALAKGVIESAFERLGTTGALKHMMTQMEKAIGKEGAKVVMAEGIQQMIYGTVQEGKEEAATSVAQDLVDYLSGVNPNALQGIDKRALESGLVGAGSGGGMTAPAAIATSLQQAGAARRTQMAKDFYLSMGQTAEAQKLRERLPEAQKSFVEGLVKDSPVENIFVPTEALDVLFQDQNPLKAMQQMGIEEAYAQAKEAGTDVKIPMATWVSNVVGTPAYEGLADDIKFSPDSKSVNELKTEREETARVLEQEAKKAQEATPAAATIEDQAAAIGTEISDQLKAAGQDEQAAIIVEKFFNSLSSRYQDAGISLSPEALFNQYKLSIAQGNEIVANGNNTLSQSELSPELRDHLSGISPKLRNSLISLGSLNQSISPESSMDSGRVGTENLTQLFEGDPTVVKEGTLGELPSLLPMLSHMRAVILDNPKILDAIVGAVPVKMVNDLFGSKRAAKVALHDEAMLKDGSAFDTELPVSSDGEGNSPVAFLINQAARAATELARESSNPGLKSQESLAASKTGNGNRLSQEGTSGPRAQIALLPESAIITLSKSADPSSFFHEASHYFFEFLTRLNAQADTPQTVKDDYQKLLKWMEVEEGQAPNTAQLEQFARGFEAYIMEGKAPSTGLKKAFATFKIWLTSVYRQLKGLNVQLNNEVRGVMDRLLATEEEIAAARLSAAESPFIRDAVVAGMSDKLATRYQKATLAARQFAEEEMTTAFMRDLTRKQQAEYKSKREEVRAEMEKVVAARPNQRALSILQTGKLPDGSELPSDTPAIKLDPKSVQAVLEANGTQDLKLPRGVTNAKTGFPVGVVAEGMGYQSEGQFLSELAATKPYKVAVEEATEQMMRGLYPDLLGAPQASDEAMKALHNEGRSEMLQLELEYLMEKEPALFRDAVRRTVRRMPSLKEVRAQANAMIGKQITRDIRPAMYQRAEVKAAKQAGEALAKGDIQAAFDAKNRELLNHELYRAAVAARAELQAAKPKFKRYFKKNDDLAKSRDMDLINAGRAILAEFGVGTTEKSAQDYLQPIQNYDQDTYQTMLAIVNSATEGAGPVEEVTYDDFSAMKLALDAIWDLSKNIKTIEVDGKKVAQETAIAAMQANISERLAAPSDEYKKSADERDIWTRWLQSARAAFTRVESWTVLMDKGEQGAFHDYMLNPVFEGVTQYRLAKKQYYQRYLELLQPLKGTLSGEEILSPELKFKFKNKAQLLGMLLHTGNSSNLSKLLRGYGWATVNEDGSLDTTKFDAFIARMQKSGVLTKADYDFVQNVWDLFEEMKPMAQKAHKSMYGFYFNEVTADEFSTPFGTYRGGYAPAKVDTFLSEDAALRSEKEQLERSNNSYAFPTAGRGATKSRVEAYAAPLQMDLGLVGSHIDWALRFSHIEPHVKAVSKMLWNKGFQQSLSALDPTVRSNMLIPWLQRTAQQSVETPSTTSFGRGIDAFCRTIRNRSSLNIMALNVVNTVEQYTGLSIAATKVSPRHLRDALWQYTQDRKNVAESVSEKSAYMRTKVGESAREVQHTIDRLLLDPTKFEQVKDFADRHGYFMQHATQGVVDIVVWNGAYNQALEKGLSEKQAVREADSIVRQTQGSGAPESVSRAETGTPFTRLFMSFYGYFNMQTNLLGVEGTFAREMGLRKGAGRGLYVYAMGFMIPAILGAALRKLAAGGFDEDDDEDYLDDFMEMFFLGQVRALFALLPGSTGQFAQRMVGLNKGYNDDKVSLSPAISAIEALVGTPQSVYKAVAEEGSKKKAVKDVLNSIGTLTGVPTGALGRQAGYLIDVNEGNAQPTGVLDFTRGLVTGRSGQ